MAELSDRRRRIAKRALEGKDVDGPGIEPDEEDFVVSLDEERAIRAGSGGTGRPVDERVEEYVTQEKGDGESFADKYEEDPEGMEDLHPFLSEAYMRRLGYDPAAKGGEAPESEGIFGQEGSATIPGDPYYYEPVEGGYRVVGVDLGRTALDPEEAKAKIGLTISRAQFEAAGGAGAEAPVGPAEDTELGSSPYTEEDVTGEAAAYPTSDTSADEPGADLRQSTEIPELDETSDVSEDKPGGDTRTSAVPDERTSPTIPEMDETSETPKEYPMSEIPDERTSEVPDYRTSGVPNLGTSEVPDPRTSPTEATTARREGVRDQAEIEIAAAIENTGLEVEIRGGTVNLSGTTTAKDLSAALANLYGLGVAEKLDLSGVSVTLADEEGTSQG